MLWKKDVISQRGKENILEIICSCLNSLLEGISIPLKRKMFENLKGLV